MSVSVKKLLIYVALAVGLGLIGWLVVGNWQGALAGLLALLPAGQAKLKQAQLDGQRQQAQTDLEGAQKQRDDLQGQFKKIDEETASNVIAIRKKWDSAKGRPPTAAEEREMLEWFKKGDKEP